MRGGEREVTVVVCKMNKRFFFNSAPQEEHKEFISVQDSALMPEKYVKKVSLDFLKPKPLSTKHSQTVAIANHFSPVCEKSWKTWGAE